MNWRSQHYRLLAEENGANAAVVDNAIKTNERLGRLSPALPPVLTLNHLAHHTDVPYRYLRSIVERKRDPYCLIRISKRPSKNGSKRYRIICIPEPQLLRVQRWIDQNILNHISVDEASVGFIKGSSIKEAARLHCRARWLIKLDIKTFFEAISELSVYRIFHEIGYQPLVALELARLCTRMRSKYPVGEKWSVWFEEPYVVTTYNVPHLGYLPQGAATSPKLSNIAMRTFDRELRDLAAQNGLRYSRYADDLTFSTINTFNRTRASRVIGKTYDRMKDHGLTPQLAKTQVVPPGARKVVLGLGVDTDTPRLTKAFRDKLRKHIHYLTSPEYGPAHHASAQGGATIYGLRNHVQGLLAFAKGIDPKFAGEMNQRFQTVDWP